MDKNTILAIVLSTIVVGVSFILQPKLFPNSYNSEKQSTAAENVQNTENSDGLQNGTESGEIKGINSVISSTDAVESDLTEETFVINTNKAEVVLTNKGGDVISYKLLNHIDVDTKDAVQMADNISDFNRACAVSFGQAGSPIVNDLFKTEKIDENTYLFTKRFTVKNDDGSENSFILGKRYSFLPDEYVFKLEILIHSDEAEGSINIGNAGYTLRTSPQIGPYFNPKLNRYENRQFISFNGNKAKRQVISGKQFKQYAKPYMWNGIGGKYFVNLVYPEKAENMDLSWYSTQIEVNNYTNAQAILVRKPVSVQDTKYTYYFYIGPRNEKDLKVYNVAENNKWNLSGLKLTECLQSSGWLGWLETILKWFLEFINKFIGNWGVSIIVMTLIIKLLLFPLTKNQSMSTLKMQEIQPKIQALQAKYKDQPQKQQEEMAKIYKEAGYNPMSGCLPMLLQFLLLWSMFNIFNNYFEFRGASFIPGWISDLSAGDSVHTFKRSIPFFGNQMRILPFIYLAVQLLSGKITGNNGATANAQTQTQMKLMMYGMPIMFFFLFYNASSGLLVYWTFSTIFQIFQQLIINGMMKKKRAELAAGGNGAGSKSATVNAKKGKK